MRVLRSPTCQVKKLPPALTVNVSCCVLIFKLFCNLSLLNFYNYSRFFFNFIQMPQNLVIFLTPQEYRYVQVRQTLIGSVILPVVCFFSLT